MSLKQNVPNAPASASIEWHSFWNEHQQHKAASLNSHIFDQTDGSFSVLDQRLLPAKMEYVRIRSVQDGFEAIKQMKVRGAPLIATVGMFSLLVDVASADFCDQKTVEMFLHSVERKCQLLLSARPTAINLANAFGELIEFLREIDFTTAEGDGTAMANRLKNRLVHFVINWQARESAENEALLQNSVEAVLNACEISRPIDNLKKLVVMTICNTGQLATSSLGTALGVILILHRLNRLQLAIALETRPYNQGSRLTAFELQHSGVPFRLIADGAAASAMRHFRVDAVLVGADQVAQNGDTANKIGTFALALIARHHQIPFFVVTPMASVNRRIAGGYEIPIEERPSEELTHWNGQSVGDGIYLLCPARVHRRMGQWIDNWGCVATCPADCSVWNPSFDVTPAELITKILTEKGNFTPKELAEQFSKSIH